MDKKVEKTWSWVVKAIGAIIGIVASWPMAYQVMVGAMLLDVISGILASIAQGKKISSEIYIRGVARKLLILALVCSLWLVSRASSLPLGEMAALAMAAGEVLSIGENCEACGIKLPHKIIQAVKSLRK